MICDSFANQRLAFVEYPRLPSTHLIGHPRHGIQLLAGVAEDDRWREGLH